MTPSRRLTQLFPWSETVRNLLGHPPVSGNEHEDELPETDDLTMDPLITEETSDIIKLPKELAI